MQAQGLGPQRKFFPTYAFFASLEEGNEDLRTSGSESCDKCIARILCSYLQGGELGERKKIFISALTTCRSLLGDENFDVLNAILSHVDRSSLLQSFVRSPFMWWFDAEGLVSFLIQGQEIEILDTMSDFFSNLTGLVRVTDREDPLPVGQLLEQIMHTVPPDFIVPSRLDLTLILSIMYEATGYWRYDRVLCYYLNHGGLVNLSDLHPAAKLWERCRDMYCNSELNTSDWPEVWTFYREYEVCFVRG